MRLYFLLEFKYNGHAIDFLEGGANMATVSFDKNIVIDEPTEVSMLVNSLLNDKPRKIDKTLASPREIVRGEDLLKLCLSLSKD